MYYNAINKTARFLIAIVISFQMSLPTSRAQEGLGNTSVGAMGVGTENPQSERSYVLGATNLIFIKVLGQEGLQQTFRLDEVGYITHPLLGRIKLSGKTVSEAEEQIRKMLEGDYILDPNVTIFVLEHSRFSVLGEVRKPGNYEILGKLSLIEGISIAGGFTPVGNDRKVKILRHDEDGEKNITVNVRDIIEGRKGNIDIQAGDVIEVPKSFF